ncbi:MAG TPA: beta-ketoacyl synthase N-terminal-like domain-containing protein [Solirubrobacteraceae bacterium]|jgi:3-oxoacyl-[acyl-carrier-protein] synthase II|nr:beta-ketoacyl synthase N-terminal-like domain-containing protein [Solirubrobacteraceae bacterium]
MSALVAGMAMRTCLGDGEETFLALLRGRAGVGGLRYLDGPGLNVLRGYHIDAEGPDEPAFRASGWLTTCVREALEDAGVDPDRQRVLAIVGTGLRELRELERWSEEGGAFATDRLHFGAAVREAAPGIAGVITLSNACSAGGHALALGQDLIELGEADAVVAAGADSMTASMLAMIGLVSEQPAEQLRPFDAVRGGAVLGEGAVAMVLVGEDAHVRPKARVLGTGLSCDAKHETAADSGGIERAMRDALERAGRAPEDVDLVIAHGTGTAINDPLECELLNSIFGRDAACPLVTALKGALGHTSGTAALMSADVAIRCLREGSVPPIVGLREPIPEAARVPLVLDHWGFASLNVVQVNAFGFGGVNAVTLLEATP